MGRERDCGRGEAGRKERDVTTAATPVDNARQRIEEACGWKELKRRSRSPFHPIETITEQVLLMTLTRAVIELGAVLEAGLRGE